MAKKTTTLSIKLSPGKKQKGKKQTNPRSLANLRPPYKPGECGNPGGRPKGSGSKKISIAYERVLEAEVPRQFCDQLGIEFGEKTTWADLLAFAMVKQAILPEKSLVKMCAVEELREVTEGRIADKLEQTGKDGAPLTTPNLQINFVKPGKKE